MQHPHKLAVLFLENNASAMKTSSILHVLTFALGILVFLGCDWVWRDVDAPIVPGTVRLDLALDWNEEPHAVETIAEDHLGHIVRIDNLQLYVAPIEFRNEFGNWIPGGEVFLLDFSQHGESLLSTLAPGNYDALRFGMGIPPEINTDIDPASYPNDHPLSVLGSAGMFWTWSSGYIFVKYEGKFAPETGQQVIEPFSYHCGTDNSYRMVEIAFEEPLEVRSESLTVWDLHLDAARALVGENDSIDLVLDPVTHNAEGTALGGRMMDLLMDAWRLQKP